MNIQHHTGKILSVRRLNATLYQFTLENLAEPKSKVIKFGYCPTQFHADSLVGKEMKISWVENTDRIVGMGAV